MLRSLGGALTGAFCGFVVWLVFALARSDDEAVGWVFVVGFALVVIGAAAGAAFANRNAKPS